MARLLLLGDSNIANNLQHQAVIGKEQFDFKKCTTKGLFLDKIMASQAEIIGIAGIDCVVNEALMAPRESERCVSLVLNNFVAKIVEKLEEADSSGKIIAVASPIYWEEFNEEVKKTMQMTFKQIRKDWKHKIKFLPPCPGMKFTQDRVHLDELSGVRYTNHIIKKLCSLAKIVPNPANNPSWADDVELAQMDEEEMEQEDSQPNPEISGITRTISAATQHLPQATFQSSLPSAPAPQPFQFAHLSQFLPPPTQQQSYMSHPISQISQPLQVSSNFELLQKIESLSKRVESVEDKSFYDNLTFAAIKEDQDDVANRGNLDRITITGVMINDFHKFAENEKPAAMKAAVNDIINFVTPEADRPERTVVFVRHRNKHIRNARSVVIEARFQEAKQAVAFRKEFVAKVKALHAEKALLESVLNGISTYPVQTQGTRVRAALLTAMANVITEVSGPNITAYCQQYLTRPMLKIVNKQNNGSNIQSYGFVDSVLKLRSHNDLHRVALHEAYQRAGPNFKGRMEQNFIILKNL